MTTRNKRLHEHVETKAMFARLFDDFRRRKINP
jgi:hypothetical protein